MTEQQKSNYQLSQDDKDDKMTYYLPTDTFKLILAFCDDTLEEKQRKAHRWWKKQVNSAIVDLKVIGVREAYERGILHVWEKVFDYDTKTYSNVKEDMEEMWIQNPTKDEWIEGYLELFCHDNMNLFAPNIFYHYFRDQLS